MSTQQTTHPEPSHSFDLADLDIQSALGEALTNQKGRKVHHALTTAWGLPQVTVDAAGTTGVPVSSLKRKAANNPDWVEDTYGTRYPFVMAAMAAPDYDPQEEGVDTETKAAIAKVYARAVEDESVSRELHNRGVISDEERQQIQNTRALIDEGIIGDAAPIEVDPLIVGVQRSAAPELELIQSVATPGFQFQYNVIDNREDPSYLSEADAAGDLESVLTPQSYTLSDETLSMKRLVGLVKVSDFSQRAMETLNYMDPRQTALGQATIAHTLKKARGMFYGDPDVGSSDGSIEDSEAVEGLAAKADAASNTTDKSGRSTGLLEDLLRELTTKIETTGLTWDRARFLVSPFFYNEVYEEQTPVIRIDGYEADVEYGPQGISLSTDQGSAPITRAPNIREYSGLSGVGANSSWGDVFLIDELAVQFRQLAPMSTVPLGRTGLSDRVAMFEYYQFVDKSQGEHIHWYQDYDVLGPTN